MHHFLVDLIKAIALLQAPVSGCTFREQPVYSVEQAGLLLFLLAKFQPSRQDPVYRFSFGELTVYTGLVHSSASVKSLTMDLGSRTFTISYGKSYEQYRLFQSIAYLEDEDGIIIKFTNDMLPYLREWKALLTSAGLL